MSLKNLKLHITDNHRDIITDIIKSTCPKNKVWVYGSRVSGNTNNDIYDGSDLDLAILGNNAPIQDLKQLFADCNVPYNIDVVALDNVPDNFKSEINKKYIVLYAGGSYDCA